MDPMGYMVQYLHFRTLSHSQGINHGSTMDVLTSSCKVTRQAAQAQAVATAVQVMTSQRICGEADFPGLSMVYLWFIYGLSMVYLWFIYGLSMVDDG